MTTTTVLPPADFVLATLERARTTREITDIMCAHGYEWPGRDYGRPTVERVHATLRALERRGAVERLPQTVPTLWRRPR